VNAASRAGGGQDRARLEFFIADIMPEVRISGHEDGHATHIPATDDTDPTWSFPPTIWDATDQQEPLAPELQRPDAYVRALMVERDALALPELRLLFQATPMPAARREAVQTALNALWPLEWDWIDLGTKGIPLRGTDGRGWSWGKPSIAARNGSRRQCGGRSSAAPFEHGWLEDTASGDVIDPTWAMHYAEYGDIITPYSS